jgi:hypothetical protein
MHAAATNEIKDGESNQIVPRPFLLINDCPAHGSPQ